MRQCPVMEAALALLRDDADRIRQEEKDRELRKSREELANSPELARFNLPGKRGMTRP